ncbi:hypothetical protein, partial [Mesorhizobium sp. M7A.F.Ca.US.014.04.1.1]
MRVIPHPMIPTQSLGWSIDSAGRHARSAWRENSRTAGLPELPGLGFVGWLLSLANLQEVQGLGL